MARGRMISKEITLDKRVNDLSGDTSRLAFTWLVTFADCEGRVHGDPAVVRSLLFPRRTDVTVPDVEKFIREWHDCGLVEWYEADGDRWIAFPKFSSHQVGLRKDREAPSSIPAPPSEELRTNAGLTPEDIPVKLKEVNGKEVNGDDARLIQELSAAFVSETRIPELTGGTEDWLEPLHQMAEAGVIVDDLVSGIQALRKNKKYKIVGPRSTVKAAIIAMSERLGTDATKNGVSADDLQRLGYATR